jgi:hypothetical protein
MNTLYNPTAIGPTDVCPELCGLRQVTTVTQIEYKKDLSRKMKNGRRNLRKCFEKFVFCGEGLLEYPRFFFVLMIIIIIPIIVL